MSGDINNTLFNSIKRSKSGEHVLEVIIDQGADEGNSFNHRGVTGVLTGDIDFEK